MKKSLARPYLLSVAYCLNGTDMLNLFRINSKCNGIPCMMYYLDLRKFRPNAHGRLADIFPNAQSIDIDINDQTCSVTNISLASNGFRVCTVKINSIDIKQFDRLHNVSLYKTEPMYVSDQGSIIHARYIIADRQYNQKCIVMHPDRNTKYEHQENGIVFCKRINANKESSIYPHTRGLTYIDQTRDIYRLISGRCKRDGPRKKIYALVRSKYMRPNSIVWIHCFAKNNNIIDKIVNEHVVIPIDYVANPADMRLADSTTCLMEWIFTIQNSISNGQYADGSFKGMVDQFIPHHIRHDPTMRGPNGQTCAMLWLPICRYFDNDIPQYLRHDPGIQNNRGQTCAMLWIIYVAGPRAGDHLDVPKYLVHDPNISDHWGNTCAMLWITHVLHHRRTRAQAQSAHAKMHIPIEFMQVADVSIPWSMSNNNAIIVNNHGMTCLMLWIIHCMSPVLIETHHQENIDDIPDSAIVVPYVDVDGRIMIAEYMPNVYATIPDYLLHDTRQQNYNGMTCAMLWIQRCLGDIPIELRQVIDPNIPWSMENNDPDITAPGYGLTCRQQWENSRTDPVPYYLA